MSNEAVEVITKASEAIAAEVKDLGDAATKDLKSVAELDASIKQIKREVAALKTEIDTHKVDIEQLQAERAILEKADPRDETEIEKNTKAIADKVDDMKRALDEMNAKKVELEKKKKTSAAVESVKETLSPSQPAPPPVVPAGSRVMPPTGQQRLVPPK